MSERFSELDRMTVERFLDRDLYGLAYQAVANELPSGSPERTWFLNAAQINAGVGPGSMFARVQTYGAYIISGQAPASGQDISDGIAQAVLGSVVNTTGVNISLAHLHDAEAGVVVDTYGLPNHLWTFSNPITSLILKNNFEFATADTSSEWTEVVVTTAVSASAAAFEVLADGIYAMGGGLTPAGEFTLSADINIHLEQLRIVKSTQFCFSGGFAQGNDLDGDGYTDATERLAALFADANFQANRAEEVSGFTGVGSEFQDPRGAWQMPDVFLSLLSIPGRNDAVSDDISTVAYVSGGAMRVSTYVTGTGGGGPDSGLAANTSSGVSSVTYTSGGVTRTSTYVTGGGGGGPDAGRVATSSQVTQVNTYHSLDHYRSIGNGGTVTGLPVVLDLDGNGIRVADLTQSQQYITGSDGLQHHTAWAGAGDGVLFIGVDNSGTISDAREYLFTEWDPTANSDLEAIRAKFDGDGGGNGMVFAKPRQQYEVYYESVKQQCRMYCLWRRNYLGLVRINSTQPGRVPSARNPELYRPKGRLWSRTPIRPPHVQTFGGQLE